MSLAYDRTGHGEAAGAAPRARPPAPGLGRRGAPAGRRAGRHHRRPSGHGRVADAAGGRLPDDGRHGREALRSSWGSSGPTSPATPSAGSSPSSWPPGAPSAAPPPSPRRASGTAPSGPGASPSSASPASSGPACPTPSWTGSSGTAWPGCRFTACSSAGPPATPSAELIRDLRGLGGRPPAGRRRPPCRCSGTGRSPAAGRSRHPGHDRLGPARPPALPPPGPPGPTAAICPEGPGSCPARRRPRPRWATTPSGSPPAPERPERRSPRRVRRRVATGGTRHAVRAEHLGAGGGEDERLLRLGAGQGGVPGEGLPDGDLEGGAGGGDHLPGAVAGEAALVVVAPSVGDSRPRRRTAAVVEHVAQGPARAGGVPEPGQDPLAGLEFGGQLGVGGLEVHEAGEVGVEAAPFGADHDHGPGAERRAGRDRVAVAGEAVGAGDHQRRGEQPRRPAGGEHGAGRLGLGHGGVRAAQAASTAAIVSAATTR